MGKALEKSERIKNVIKAYKNDENLFIRQAAQFYKVNPQSVLNHFNKKRISVSDCYIFYQKFAPIEKIY
jgi:hypothetical protein